MPTIYPHNPSSEFPLVEYSQPGILRVPQSADYNRPITVIPVDGPGVTESTMITYVTNLFTTIHNATNITYIEIKEAKGNGNLNPGNYYYVTDKEIYLHAITNNTISPFGYKRMACPSWYKAWTDTYGNVWKGVWRPELTDAGLDVNDLVVWGARVWKSKTGNKGSKSNDYTLDATNWLMISPTAFTNHEYTQITFGVYYDLANDWVCKQWDNNGNVVGVDYAFAVAGSLTSRNPCEYTDWNYATIGKPFFNNQVQQILNNYTTGGGIYNNYGGKITNNRNGGNINHNHTVFGVTSNKNTAQIEFNIAIDINGNSNTGEILANHCPVNSISLNANAGKITNNRCRGILSNEATVTDIMDNNIVGLISANANAGAITDNTTGGQITSNYFTGYIKYNRNNGNIDSNGGTGNIFNNTNNGNVSGKTLAGDISDAIVNK